MRIPRPAAVPITLLSAAALALAAAGPRSIEPFEQTARTTAFLPRLDLRANEAAVVVGRVGGTTHALVATDSHVFAAVDRQLVVFDVSRPSGVRIVGATAELGANIQALAIVGDALIAAAGQAGLVAYDIDNPAEPRRGATAGIRGGPTAVAAAGSLLAVATSAGSLVLLEVPNPNAINVLGQLRGAGQTSALAYGDGHVFLAQPGGAVRIVNVADATTPRLVADLAPGGGHGPSGDIEWRAGFVYIAAGPAGVRVADVSAPEQPAHLGWLGLGADVRDLAVAGRVVVAADAGSGLHVLDLGEPAQPQPVGQLAVDGGLSVVDAAGSIAYAAAADQQLITVSLADAQAPRMLDRYAPPDRPTGVALGAEHAVAIFGAPEVGMGVVSGGYRPPPSAVGFLPLSPADPRDAPPPEAVRIQAGGRQAFLLYYDALLAVDVSAPAAPTIDRLLAVPGATDLAVDEGLLVVAGWGLRVFDVSRSGNPRLVGSVIEAGDGLFVAAAGGKAYVAHREVSVGRPVSLRVYDLTDPAQPRRVGWRANIGATAGLAARAGFVYQARMEEGVTILDARNPLDIRVAGAFHTRGAATAVELGSDALYVVEAPLAAPAGAEHGRHGVHIVDVSRPGEPVSERFVHVGAPIRDIAVADGLLYLAAGDRGLLVVKPPR